MLESIQQAASFNQKGASLAASGNFEEALQCMHRALESITIASQKVFSDTTNKEKGSSLFPPNLLPSQKNKGSSYFPNDRNHFVYAKPFFFNPEACISEQEISSYGAIILFNLALIYHLRAESLGDTALVMSRRLYDKSWDLLNHGSKFDCSNVMIALLNNRASIHDELLEFEEACNNFLLLSDLISKAIIKTDTLDREDLRDIFLNMYFFKIPMCASSA